MNDSGKKVIRYWFSASPFSHCISRVELFQHFHLLKSFGFQSANVLFKTVHADQPIFIQTMKGCVLICIRLAKDNNNQVRVQEENYRGRADEPAEIVFFLGLNPTLIVFLRVKH